MFNLLTTIIFWPVLESWTFVLNIILWNLSFQKTV